MIQSNGKTKIILTVLFIVLFINLKFTFSNRNDLKRMEERTIYVAQELDKLKLDISAIESRTSVVKKGQPVPHIDSSVLVNMQNRLSEMKKEIETIRKRDGESPALEEYRKKEEELWLSHSENVKKAWSVSLNQNLMSAGFDEVEREMVISDYEVALDRIRDEQLRWYRGDITVDDLNYSTKVLSQEFYHNMSYSVGEEKALTVMKILFPDPAIRKNLIDE